MIKEPIELTVKVDRVIKYFNINNRILVKLTDSGYEHWKSVEDTYLPLQWQKPIGHYIDKSDENGMVEFQMWEFMRLFGSTLYMGANPMFETNIYFSESDLK